MRSRPAQLLIPMQAAAAIIALVALTMSPPPSGRILLVPLSNADINAVAGIALAGGALLLGAGPITGSLVVVGDKARIARQIRSWRVILLAAPPAGCGANGTPRGSA